MAEPRGLPLFASAEHAAGAGQANQLRRNGRRRAVLVLTAAAVAVLVAPAIFPPRPRLLWNASASAPIGLYLMRPAAPLRRGDLVVAWLPAAARALAAERNYLPSNVPAVKYVGALAGDRVCAAGPFLSINGKRVVVRRRHDGHGRPLPRWSGCATLDTGHLLLINPPAPASFDGRYFGASDARDVIGAAILLWRP